MTPDFSLSGGVALVTGAGSGIGRAIALGLAGAGAHVGCVDRVPRNAEATAAQILAAGSRAVPVAADVTDPAALSAAVAQIESALGPLTLGLTRPASPARLPPRACRKSNGGRSSTSTSPASSSRARPRDGR